MMSLKEPQWIKVVAILSVVLLASCGPSPEEQAATAVALTATAATDTPTPTLMPTPTPTSTPTPTPTPIPYDLSVLVKSEDDAPIVGATVVLAEAREEAGTQITDAVGQAFWYDLPGETVNLSISAQGYFQLTKTDSIERGVNQITLVLERDPHGLLPSEACAPGERLLYIEDFQDGEAQGWDEIEFRTQGWDLGPHPDSQGNKVVLNLGDQWAWTTLRNRTFTDGVWRIHFMTDRKRIHTFMWLTKEGYETKDGSVEFSAYTIRFEPGWIDIFRTAWPLSNISLRTTSVFLSSGEWHLLEVSTFEGRLEVWLDGRRFSAYNDPQPLPSGTLGINFEESPGVQSVYYFDNISVCELTEPFIPLPTPES